MILIVVALKVEAKSIIDFYDLKRVDDNSFEIYQNSKQALIISGVGKFNATVATTYIISKFSNIKKIINFGICGARKYDNINIGDIFLVHKISDYETKRDFFPNILLKHNLIETDLTTFNNPVNNEDFDTKLADMEAFGFFFASLRFLSIEKIIVIKIVSDFLSPQKFKKEYIISLINNKIEVLDEFIQNYVIVKTPILSIEDINKIDSICDNLNLSFSNKVQLTSMIKYFNCKNNF
jgi:nucleoside phosphorylase